MAAPTKNQSPLGALSPNAMLVVAWVLGVALIVGGYFFLLYTPLSEERVTEEARRTRLGSERLAEETNLRRYNTDAAELARARQHAQDLQNVLPNDSDIPGFMRNINALAEASGLQIQLIQPVAERVEQYFARIPVEIRLRGSYLSLARFFHAVSALPRVINMENIRLDAQATGPTPATDAANTDVMLNASVLATTFRSVSGTPAPAAARGGH